MNLVDRCIGSSHVWSIVSAHLFAHGLVFFFVVLIFFSFLGNFLFSVSVETAVHVLDWHAVSLPLISFTAPTAPSTESTVDSGMKMLTSAHIVHKVGYRVFFFLFFFCLVVCLAVYLFVRFSYRMITYSDCSFVM